MVQDKVLKNLPTPSQRHVAALDSLIEGIYNEHGLDDTDLEYRQTVVQLIQNIITAAIPGWY